MKKYIDEYENIYLVGEKQDIKNIYKKMVKAKNADFVPLFTDDPFFSENNHIYAICIESISKWFYIVNSDNILEMIINNELAKYNGLI